MTDAIKLNQDLENQANLQELNENMEIETTNPRKSKSSVGSGIS